MLAVMLSLGFIAGAFAVAWVFDNGIRRDKQESQTRHVEAAQYRDACPCSLCGQSMLAKTYDDTIASFTRKSTQEHEPPPPTRYPGPGRPVSQ